MTHPGGRPTLYKEEYCEMLVDHMSKGFTFESFAAALNTTRENLYEWKRKHPEFSYAHKKGIEKSLVYWEQLGLSGIHAEKFNAAVWIFNMKNKHKWTDKTEMELTGRDGGPLQITAIPAEEIQRRLIDAEQKIHELEAGEES